MLSNPFVIPASRYDLKRDQAGISFLALKHNYFYPSPQAQLARGFFIVLLFYPKTLQPLCHSGMFLAGNVLCSAKLIHKMLLFLNIFLDNKKQFQ
jgi:hypothetical protein